MTQALELLAADRARGYLDEARQQRLARRQRSLCRARHRERRAERRLIQAWRQAAELRARLESPEY